MKKSMKEIAEIITSKPSIKSKLESFITLAVIRPGNSKDSVEIYLDNLEEWVSLPISEILDIEEIDNVAVGEELYKLVHLEISIPKVNNAYQAMLKDALISIGNLVKDDCSGKSSCSCDDESNDSKNRNSGKVYKMGGNKPVKKPKAGSGSGSGNCYSCKFIAGRWWCITWATCLEATT